MSSLPITMTRGNTGSPSGPGVGQRPGMQVEMIPTCKAGARPTARTSEFLPFRSPPGFRLLRAGGVEHLG